MASQHIYVVANSADNPSAAGANKTIIQLITGATRKSWVLEFGIGFKSVTATDVPGAIFFARQSTAGTNTAVTPGVTIEGQPVAIDTAAELFTGAEPTTGATVGGPWELTPIGGLFVYQFPAGQELEMAVSSRLGLIALTAAVQNCRAYIKYAE